jgi:hypothetical protein
MTLEQVGETVATVKEKLRCVDCGNPVIPWEGVSDCLEAADNRDQWNDILEDTIMNQDWTVDCVYHRRYLASWSRLV